ncbi:tetratricopeptide repeat protein [Ancylomarina sp. YFZ004]
MKIPKFSLVSMGVIMVLICAGIISFTSQKADQKVFEAYELRITGHADSAKVLLEQITNENPKDALAWFELCRTTLQIGMANPRAIKETLDETLKHIHLAVENDPDNAMYLSYKGKIEVLHFYMGMQMGNKNAAEYLDKFEKTYNSVFQLDSSYYENKLTLVEFFGGLPVNMGGDPEKAERYAKELEEADIVAGAKAREILMPEDADYQKFWKEIIEREPGNADVNQALGRVYLLMQNIDEANKYYQKAIDLDPSKNVLYLDLGRYYMMKAMRNPALIDSVAPLVEEQFNKFINSTPKPINPMKAWAYGTLSMINRRGGNNELAEKYKEMAEELDPFYSRASAKPGKAIYSPPDVVVHEQSYFLSPF